MESFWACVVNPVAVTFPPSSDERAEKRGRERERGGGNRESEEEQKTRVRERGRGGR